MAYLRVKYKTGETVWQFLIANSKIAKEEMTIPRRELSSIKLAVKNIGQIKKAIGIEEKDVCFYTDSQIALAWIEKSRKEAPNQLGEFLNNTTKFILVEHCAE